MTALNSTVDGMGFEEMNQPVTFTEIGSTTNLYAAGSMTAPFVDTDNIDVSDTISATTISGTNIYATTLVDTTTLSATTGSITNIAGVETGSIDISYINNAWLASSTGSVGFYGTTPIAKPDTEVNIGSLVIQLVTLGLVGSIA